MEKLIKLSKTFNQSANAAVSATIRGTVGMVKGVTDGRTVEGWTVVRLEKYSLQISVCTPNKGYSSHEIARNSVGSIS